VGRHYHSIFARILRTEAEKIGYPSDFTIYDTEDTKNVLSAIVKEMNLDREAYNINTLRSRISAAKSSLITPKLYQDNEELREEDRRANRPLTYSVYEKYTARCKRSGAMDFDDLLYRLYELFQRNPDNILDKYRKRFRYLLVDEFQDTNHLQYAIVRKLVNYDHSPRNVCVVGDDAQSIYAFRGATIQNILDFEQDFKPFGIKVFKLEQNYRSTEHIVQSANEVITHNSRQIQKKIWSDKGQGQRVKIIKARTDTEEGNRVVDTILEQKNRYHLSNSDIAVLYRTNAQSRIFEEYLRRFNVPYRIFGGQSFYQRKEVKDLIGYLRLAVNPGDEEALRRVINFPRRGIGETSVDKISELAGQTNRRMWDCIPEVEMATRTRSAVADFVTMIQEFHRRSATDNAYDLAIDVARRSGLMDELKKDTTIEGIGRLDNVNALLDGIKTFVEDPQPSRLSSFGRRRAGSGSRHRHRHPPLVLPPKHRPAHRSGRKNRRQRLRYAHVGTRRQVPGIQVGIRGGHGGKTLPFVHVLRQPRRHRRRAPPVLRGHHPRRAVPHALLRRKPLPLRADAHQRGQSFPRRNAPVCEIADTGRGSAVGGNGRGAP
jgi:DNA helicase-2/ATP-dependent DNA helicase PcrA